MAPHSTITLRHTRAGSVLCQEVSDLSHLCLEPHTGCVCKWCRKKSCSLVPQWIGAVTGLVLLAVMPSLTLAYAVCREHVCTYVCSRDQTSVSWHLFVCTRVLYAYLASHIIGHSYEASVIAIKFLHALWQLSVAILTSPVSSCYTMFAVHEHSAGAGSLKGLALSSGCRIKFQLVCITGHSSSCIGTLLASNRLCVFGYTIGSGQMGCLG